MRRPSKALLVAHVVVAVALCWPTSWGFSPSRTTWLWLGAWAVVCMLRVPLGLMFWRRSGNHDRDVLSWRMVAVALAAGPLAEEIIFRGAFQDAVGIVPAALVFGLAHTDNLDSGSNLPTHSAVAVLLGLVLGWFAQAHGLWFAVVAHVMSNAGAVAARILADRENAGDHGTLVAPPNGLPPEMHIVNLTFLACRGGRACCEITPEVALVYVDEHEQFVHASGFIYCAPCAREVRKDLAIYSRSGRLWPLCAAAS